ncbi:MAG: DNA double-strand break repair nuclease NurA [archaeon]
MQKAIRQIIDSISLNTNKKESDIYPSFKDKRYAPCILSKENVHRFSAKDHNLKVSAIDGGNIEIMKTADLSLHLVRIYFNIFKNNKRLTPKTIPQKIDFYALAQSYQKDREIYYQTRLIPLKEKDTIYLPDEKDLIFDSYDPTLTTGIFRTPVSKIGEISRRFAEWTISRHIIEQELDEGDIILRDGSLQTGITNESRYSESLYGSAEKKKIIFCGISKTSALLTNNGKSLTSSINRISGDIKGTWFYHPIVKSSHPDHKAEMYNTRLNIDSPYSFRFEIYDRQKESAKTVIEQLAHTSKDISFPGYPYPLIDADKNARVKFKEIAFHKTMIERSIEKDKSTSELLDSGIRAINAHAVIDRIV